MGKQCWKRWLCREAAATQNEVWSLNEVRTGSALRDVSNRRLVNTRKIDQGTGHGR